MQSRAARLTSGLVAWIALGAAAFLVISSQQLIDARRETVRAFEFQAHHASEALGDLRAAQQAYVADGQGPDFWAPKVASLLESTATAVEDLRTRAASAAARGVLIEASSNIAEFANIDQQARQYLEAGQTLMASDVIFASGVETSSAASRQIEASLLAEHQSFDLLESAIRRRQVYTVGGVTALTLLIVGMLTRLPPATTRTITESRHADGDAALENASNADDLSLRPEPTEPSHVEEAPRVPLADLKAAAELCTRFGAVKEVGDLRSLLEQAATLIDAGGLIVWLGNTAGDDMRPVLAHGYSDEALGRMASIPRSADNAAATAYRSGRLQIVLAKPGVSSGALVVPLLSPQGTIGALTAETTEGGEASDWVQAIASILAAQLATILAPSTEAVETRNQPHCPPQDHSASA